MGFIAGMGNMSDIMRYDAMYEMYVMYGIQSTTDIGIDCSSYSIQVARYRMKCRSSPISPASSFSLFLSFPSFAWMRWV